MYISIKAIVELKKETNIFRVLCAWSVIRQLVQAH
jgi:hypothetical protein